MLKRISYWTGIAVIGTIVGFSLQFAKAWTEPAVAPPGGNVGAPINVSATAQVKSGPLGVSGAFRGYSTAVFDGSVGIGTAAPGYKLDVAGSINGTSLCVNGSCFSSIGNAFYKCANLPNDPSYPWPTPASTCVGQLLLAPATCGRIEKVGTSYPWIAYACPVFGHLLP